MSKYAVATALIDGALCDGGATVTVDGLDYEGTGWAVGGKHPSMVLPADDSRDNLIADAIWFQIDSPANYYGSWLHEGRIHLDAVTIVGSREEAEALGRERGELAIFHPLSGKEVTL